MKSKTPIVLVAVSLLIAIASPTQLGAQQPPQYDATFTGSLGGCCSEPFGTNNSGAVTGIATLPGDLNAHAFLSQNGVIIDLGTLGGPNSNGEFGGLFGPNELGQVVGGSETNTPDPLGEDFCFYGNFLTCSAFVWSDGVMTALPTLGGNNGTALDINDRGQVVGGAENTTPDATCAGLPPPLNQIAQIQSKPVIWENGAIRELPTFPGDPDGAANAINDQGQIVGATGNCGKGPEYALHALLWEDGAFTDLGNLGGTLFSFAANINDRGDVIGASNLPGDTTSHAFFWTRDSGMKDLGTLPGDFSSSAADINSKGQVTGQSCDADGNCRGVLWQNGVITDLETLVAGGGSTFFVFEGRGINSRGQISVIAFDSDTGECCSFLLNPRNAGAASTAATKAVPSGGSSKVDVLGNVRKLLNRTAAKRPVHGSGSPHD
jgi:probable HAF family extracellular repeat protein